MRKELYEKLCKALRGVGDGMIRHIDMWNRNVEFIEQETAWERPAVFIEFEPIVWSAQVTGVRYVSEARLRLHIITDWFHACTPGERTGLGIDLDLPERIHEAIAGLSGDSFTDLRLAESITNHNHEEIVESIEVYTYVAYTGVDA